MTFNHKTIEELHDLLVKKEISAVELTQATLADIKEREAAVVKIPLVEILSLTASGIPLIRLSASIPLASRAAA